MAFSWDKVNEGEDFVFLPQPVRKMTDKNHFVEISYKEEDGKIIRMCRSGEITKKQKRVSKAARARQANFKKFGAVAAKPNGTIEKGITETRVEEFGVVWEGASKQEQKDKMKAANKAAFQASKSTATAGAAAKAGAGADPIQAAAAANMQRAPSALASNKPRGYVPPGLRAGARGSGFDDEEITYEIRISNLPDSTQQDDIRNMMSAFFHTEYFSKSRKEKDNIKFRPPDGRIKVYCFKSRIEQDTNAIVDVKTEYWQKKCIEMLDGQSYGYNIIKVEKSKPKKRKY